MLEEYRTRLKVLANDPNDTFDEQVELMKTADAALVCSPLRDMVLTSPAMLEAVQAWSGDASVSPHFKKTHGFLLSYLFHEDDILPDNIHGLFGYLDDSFLIGLAFQRAAAERSAWGKRLSPDLQDIALQVPGWLNLCRRLLPDETHRLELMFNDLIHGDQAGCHSVFTEKS